MSKSVSKCVRGLALAAGALSLLLGLVVAPASAGQPAVQQAGQPAASVPTEQQPADSGASGDWSPLVGDPLTGTSSGDGADEDAVAYINAQNTGGVKQVSAGGDHTCAVTSGGYVYCWGVNSAGQLGNGSFDGPDQCIEDPEDPWRVYGCSKVPVKVVNSDDGGFVNGQVKSVSAGRHTCAVTTEGYVYCWGKNQYGNLGNNTTTRSPVPVKVANNGDFVNGAVESVSTKGEHTCALTTEGYVYCWGYNLFGQLGNNSKTGPEKCGSVSCSKAPVKVVNNGDFVNGQVRSVSVGSYYSCAVTTGNTVYCWGSNSVGQLGNGEGGDGVSAIAPAKVKDGDEGFVNGQVREVAAGGSHTCAVTTGNTVYCWGRNYYGELGNGQGGSHFDLRKVPVKVKDGDEGFVNGQVKSVSGGSVHTCAVTTGNTVYCWGNNEYGQLGNNSTTNAKVPTKVKDGDEGFVNGQVREVAAGGAHVCALTEGNTVYCWGLNGSGQLGNGDTNELDVCSYRPEYPCSKVPVVVVSVNVVPDPVEFGDIYQPTGGSKQVTVTGVNGWPLGTVPAEVTNGGGMFSVSPSSCDGSGGVCVFTVSVVSGAPAGVQSGELTLTDGGGSSRTVPLLADVVPASVDVSPNRVTFGELDDPDKREVRTVTFTNETDSDVTDTPVTVNTVEVSTEGDDGDAFEIVEGTDECSGQPVAPETACTVDVRFDAPKRNQDFTGLLTFTGDDFTDASVSLVGQLDGSLELDGLNPNGVGGDGSFGKVVVNESKKQTLTMKALADVTITDTSITTDNDNGTWTKGQSDCKDARLQEGDTCTIEVTFTPQSRGDKAAVLVFTTNQGDEQVALTGTGVQGLLVANDKDFGDVTVDTTATKTVRFTNEGDGPITVDKSKTAWDDGSAFSKDRPDGSCTQTDTEVVLEPGETCGVKVEFTPTDAADYMAVARIVSNADGSPNEVPVTGTGVFARAVVSPDPIEMQRSDTGGAKETVTITNDSTGVLSVEDIKIGTAKRKGFPKRGKRLSRADAKELFTITNDNCSGEEVPANGTCRVTVKQEKGGNKVREAALIVTSNDPDSPSATQIVSFGGDLTASQLTSECLTAEGAPQPVVPRGGDCYAVTTVSSDGTSQDATDLMSWMRVEPGAGAVAGEIVEVTNAGESECGEAAAWSCDVLWKVTAGQDVGPLSGTLTTTADDGGGFSEFVDEPVVTGTIMAPVMSATDLDFGIVPVYDTRSGEVTVTNDGPFDLEITDVQFSDDTNDNFTLDSHTCDEGPIPVDGTCTVTVEFQPLKPGPTTGELLFTTNTETGRDTAGVGGIGEGGSVNIGGENSGVDADGYVRFGEVRLGESEQRAVTITNAGKGALVLSGLSIDGDDNSMFALDNGGTCEDQWITAGQSCSIPLSFMPTRVGEANAFLTAVVNTDDESLEIPLTGTGINPELSITPGQVTFGEVDVNDTATQDITLTSAGTTPVTNLAASVSGSDDFSISENTCPETLTVTESCVVTVAFTPSDRASRAGQVTITANTAASPHEVSLSGAGVGGTLAADPLDIGDVKVGTTGSGTVRITNSDSGTLKINDVSVNSSQGDGWKITDDRCSGKRLATNETCAVEVQVKPQSVGGTAAWLTVTSNSPDSPDQIAMTANGIQGLLVAVPAAIEFGTVGAGESATESTQIINAGDASLVLSDPVELVPTQGKFRLANSTDCADGDRLSVGASCTIAVTYTPTEFGQNHAQVRVVSDDARSPLLTVPVVGDGDAGAVTISPAVFADPVSVGSPEEQPVTATSIGSQPVTVNDILLAQGKTAGAGVTVDTAACENTTLQPGDTCEGTVTADPVRAGGFTARMTVDSDAPGRATAPVVGVAASAGIAVDAVDFGTVDVTDTASQPLTITSTGADPLDISTITVAEPFAIDSSDPCTSTVLNRGEQCQITVTFTPTAEGTVAELLAIESNVPDSPTLVGVAGTGQGGNLGIDGPDAGNGVGDGSIAFGDVVVHDRKTKKLTVSNSGPGKVKLTGTDVTGDDGLGVVDDGCQGRTLSVGDECSIRVGFMPDREGPHAATLTVLTSNAGGNPTVALSGNGVAPAVTITPNDGVNFGTVDPTDDDPTVSRTVTVTSTGTSPVTISEIVMTRSDNGVFALSSVVCDGTQPPVSLPATLAAGQTCTATATFTATSAGQFFGELEVRSDAASSADQVALSGTGTGTQLVANPVAIGDVRLGKTKSDTVVVSNAGPGRLKIDQVRLVDKDGDLWQKTNDTCSNAKLAVNETCEVDVSITPERVGQMSVAVKVTSNADSSPDLIAVTANGVAATLDVDPEFVTFGDIAVGDTSHETVTVTNVGTTHGQIDDVKIAGENADDFTVVNARSDCGGKLDAGETCDVRVKFTPSKRGARTAHLTLTGEDITNSPVKVALTGGGAMAAATADPITFGQVEEPATDTLTITSVGDAALTVDPSTARITGSTEAKAAFTVANDTCGEKVPVNDTCSLTVTFTPTGPGLIAGDVLVEHNGDNSPLRVAVTGTGLAGQVAISPVAIKDVPVGDSATGTATITNTGTRAVDVTGVTLDEASDSDLTITGNTCAGLLEPDADCTATVTYTPQTAGLAPGRILVDYSDARTVAAGAVLGRAVSGSLVGEGIVFGRIPVGDTATETTTLRNETLEPVAVDAIVVAGGSQFALNSSSCGASIPVGGSCQITVDFTPDRPALFTGEVQISGPTFGGMVLPLTGAGAGGFIGIGGDNNGNGSGVVTIGTTEVGTTVTNTLTITNDTDAAGPVTITGLTLTGTEQDQFTIISNECGEVAPGGSCEARIEFAPTTAGSKSATVVIASTSLGSPDEVAVLGIGTQAAITAATEQYGNVDVGTAYQRNVRITNTGTAPLRITKAAISDGGSDFRIADSSRCVGVAVPPGESCNIAVSFIPTVDGQRTGVLTLTSNSGSSPDGITLTGRGVLPADPNEICPPTANGDCDGDGIPNSQDPDSDGDGIPNANDPDDNGDGIMDTVPGKVKKLKIPAKKIKQAGKKKKVKVLTKWKEPTELGGTPVTGYEVRKRLCKQKKSGWTCKNKKLNKKGKKYQWKKWKSGPDPDSANKKGWYKKSLKLGKGKKFKIQVRAVNDVGPGKKKAKKVMAKPKKKK